MKLNVSYASSNEYVRFSYVSMLSLFENNKEFSSIFVYFIDAGLTEESKKMFIHLAKKYNRNLKFIPINDLFKNWKTIKSFGHSYATYAKLFFSSVIDEDKIIYLDSDSIVEDSFKELWQIDLKDNLVAGVLEDVAPRNKYIIGQKKSDNYINCGFLLINLQEWREQNIESKFINIIKKYKGDVPFWDQGVINSACKNKIFLLHPKYNCLNCIFAFNANEIKKVSYLDYYYSQNEIDEAKNHPVFIHYVDGIYNRPWCKNCTHPLKNRYIFYLDKTPWANCYIEGYAPKNSVKNYQLYKRLPFPIFYRLRLISNFIKEKIGRFDKNSWYYIKKE
ncbi:glycosyltransferase family 8 protein [Eubacterium callanderi]|uniref:glycosyltransferase family 8 protein n=1 Tax=Eubacterium callanderi TaxID=53442 RepID=UPI0026711F20|nr:glycosyltransferase family 8 protein [Eubacterium callanderi]